MKSWIAAAALLLTPVLAAAQKAPLPARDSLLGELEAWRSAVLPQTVPMNPFTAKYQPRLDDIKKSVQAAAKIADLVRPRKDFEAWKTVVLHDAYHGDRAHGLTRKSFNEYAKEQATVARVIELTRAQVESARLEAQIRRIQAVGATSPSRSGSFFDQSAYSPFADATVIGSGPRPAVGSSFASQAGVASFDDGAVFAEPDFPAGDPRRYRKMRDLLVSQGASPKVVDAAIAEGLRQGVDPRLVLSVIWKESGFKTRAYNRGSGATGLMQLLPSTARGVGVRGDLFDIGNNLRAGVKTLKWIANDYFKMGVDLSDIERLGAQKLKTILASYNAGIGNVSKWLRRQQGVLSHIPFAETRNYVLGIKDKLAAWLGLD